MEILIDQYKSSQEQDKKPKSSKKRKIIKEEVEKIMESEED